MWRRATILGLGLAIGACALIVVLATPLLAQSPLPTFVFNAQTVISVTVTLADGQVVVVPVDLTFITRSEREGAYMTLAANPTQPTNATVLIENSGHISASMGALIYPPTITPVAVVPPTVAPTLAPVVEAPTATAVPPTAMPPTPAPAVAITDLTYQAVCEADTNNMTDPQITAFANQYVGQPISQWQGWVYDVVSKPDGTYDLSIAMQESGLFWSRNIVIENIPTDLAVSLNVEQPLTFSGRIARNEVFLEGICNPLVIDNFTLH